jgi:hypothetical protein
VAAAGELQEAVVLAMAPRVKIAAQIANEEDALRIFPQELYLNSLKEY